MSPKVGLVMKWFFNGSSGLVYQWIPPMRPQVIGLLKGKVDLDFKISDDPLQAYRAIKIRNPTTDLSGNYTCVVSTFLEEDRQTRTMLVYSPAQNFRFVQEKKYVFLVTLICSAENMYPKPIMVILSNGVPLKQTVTEMKMDSWGLYSVTSTAVVHDDDVKTPLEEFVCELSLPPANYTINRTTIYYPGLMPTAYIATFEVNKPQERLSNGITDSPLCRACMEEEETALHIIQHCPAVSDYRPRYLGPPRSPPEITSNIKGLLGFFGELGWLE
ncbi:hypothetical protein RR48_14792 [Papilio machaon]|uniref:Ig-like domain-containing protein n=1 Tax=Papilio machaon TaxID=76193 RepID=A0A194R028_PAPMA|nr:hypothetical protein RR48_14792 [Papilio machaon]